jgi:hypothetical protein
MVRVNLILTLIPTLILTPILILYLPFTAPAEAAATANPPGLSVQEERRADRGAADHVCGCLYRANQWRSLHQ